MTHKLAFFLLSTLPKCKGPGLTPMVTFRVGTHVPYELQDYKLKWG